MQSIIFDESKEHVTVLRKYLNDVNLPFQVELSICILKTIHVKNKLGIYTEGSGVVPIMCFSLVDSVHEDIAMVRFRLFMNSILD